MFSFTNYSLFYMTELKYRFFYIFLNIFIISIYSLYYINFFIIMLLKPLESLNLDFNNNIFIQFIVDNFFFNNYDFFSFHSESIVSDSYNKWNEIVYDYYPIFEINIKSNAFLILYIFEYFFFLFIFPIFFYQMYLFFLPGLYTYEFFWLKKQFIYFLLFFFIFMKYLNPFFIIIFLFFTFNNYYEFLNYEFDIEFDFLYFVKINIIFLFLFYINIIFFLLVQKNIVFQTILIIMNWYLTPFFIHFLLILSFFYIKDYLILFFFYINNNNNNSFQSS